MLPLKLGGSVMTAEVAVLNRSAVALAADSAVTLSGLDPASDVDKIFQNENKLFELSVEHPVGIMLYNATSFFDVPWEVIIKDFRRDTGSQASDDLFSWADRFRAYLSQHGVYHPSEDRQKDFVQTILQSEMSTVHALWSDDVQHLILSKQTATVKQQYPERLYSRIERRVAFYEAVDYYEGFDENESINVFNIYRSEYENAKNEIFGHLPLEKPHHEGLERLARAILTRSRRNWFTTGLVFAGYGAKELFPSLVSLEVGGVLSNRLRWSERRRVDIDRASTTAEIIPFAQRETVDTLLFGRSDSYERRIVSHFAKALSQVGKGLVDQLTRPGQKRKDFEVRVDAAVNALLTNFRQQHSDQLKAAFADDTLDIVRHMPKPDLAAFAESLVTVSSMMRKVSVGPETVGGPVDVAVISRHEGFIWVKRKHYFDAELNRRYVSRAFGGR